MRLPKVAYFSPFNPDPSGVSDYSEELLPHLERHWDLTLFVDGYYPSHPVTRRHPVVDCNEVDPVPQLADFDAVVYHVGNSESHDYIYDTLMRWPGLVVLHELSLHHLIAARTLNAGRRDLYLSEIRAQHGEQGADRARKTLWGADPPPWEAEPLAFPLNRRILGHATGVLAHSRFVADGVRGVHPDLHVSHVEHHAFPPPESIRSQVESHLEARRTRTTCRFVTAGNQTKSKRVETMLRGLNFLRERAEFRCQIVGGGTFRETYADLIEQLEFGNEIEATGRVSRDELYLALANADACICLREPTLGETSGIAMRALACGTPVVVSDAGWFSELPDEIALKVSATDHTGRELANAIEELIRSPDRRRAMSLSARDWAAERSPEASAEGYADFVAAAGLFPNRWIGRGFQRTVTRLHELDLEYSGYAAKQREVALLELSAWSNPPDARSAKERQIRRRARKRRREREGRATTPSNARRADTREDRAEEWEESSRP